MPQQIKLNIIQSLFRIFSFLADKTNGGAMFVKPKILLGSIILGLTACSPNTAKQNTPEETENTKIETEKVDTGYVYQVSEVETQPDFPGGMQELLNFIRKNLRYPMVMCYEGPVQGRVVCSFFVEKDGSISNVEVVKSLDPACDKEAIRIIESMPKWIPGEQNGVKARVQYTLPVIFKLYD